MITEVIRKEIEDKKGLIKKVIKRNGDIADFKKEKIVEAIFKAAQSVGGEDESMAQTLTDKVVEELVARYNRKTIPAIEEIQDMVETVLIKSGHAKTAKAYILYREQHNKIREKEKLILDINKTMDGYLNQSDWRVNENSNVNYSLGGLILHNSGTITANYWLNNIYPKDVADAHRNGDFHIHDLSMFSGYCAGWSLRQLIEEGFGGVTSKINSRPAKHLSTLISQMVNFLGTMQNEWAGAQAFSSFDTYLAPFVREDKMTFEEVKQQIQSFVFSINTPSRWGSQAPFTNIT
ncbi:MAG: anaerobic ribonucleoside-triphosphate reductase, partial [Candidatus Margulisiibacteriota bacterium]